MPTNAPTHDTTVQHRTMTYMAVLFDYRIVVGETMHHKGVLDIGASFQHNASEISTQTGIGTDIAVFSDDDIADQ